MTDLTSYINLIKNTPDIRCGKPLQNEQLLRCRQFLHQQQIALPPDTFIELLKHFNGLILEDAAIFGILPEPGRFTELGTENIRIAHPLRSDLIILGADGFDLLAYNAKYEVYQIIDKQDFEVLEEYEEFIPALNHILKIIA